MAKRKQLETVLDALATVEVVLGGAAYKLCYTYAGLLATRAELDRRGIRTRVLGAFELEAVDVDSLPAFLYGALVAHQPEMTYDDALALIDLRSSMVLPRLLAETFLAAVTAEGEAAKKAAKGNGEAE